MKVPMMSIPRKRPSSDLDLENKIMKYVQDSTEYEYSMLSNGVEQLLNLRRIMLELYLSEDEEILGSYFRYYALLGSLKERIPVNSDGAAVNFYWYDIFKDKKSGKKNIKYERACVLFNIAAQMTTLGANESLTHNDSIKEAATWYRKAGGILEYLRSEMERDPDMAVTDDLKSDTLQGFIFLLQGQIQELFFIRAKTGGMKNTVISQLAAQASDFYECSLDILQSSQLKNSVPKKWRAYLELKKNYLLAEAHYQLGKKCKEDGDFGIEVARYQFAYKIVQESETNKSKNFVEDDFKEFYTEYIKKVSGMYGAAKKDNSLIYHAEVPKESTLDIQKKSMASLLDISELNYLLIIDPDDDPFSNFVPNNIKQASSTYDSKCNELIKQVGREIQTKNDEIKLRLKEMKLPDILDAHISTEGLPPSLKKKISEIKKDGGVTYLRNRLVGLKNRSDESSITLNILSEDIAEEEKEDESLKTEYASKWNRATSRTTNAELKKEIRRLTSELGQATNSDKVIQQNLDDDQESIQFLCKDENIIIQLLPVPMISITPSSVEDLKHILTELENLERHRETMLNELKESITKDDITRKLLEERTTSQEQVFNERLRTYQPLIEEIRGTFEHQKEIVSRLTSSFNDFLSLRGGNDIVNERQKVIQELEKGYYNYIKVKNFLEQGDNFYVQLDTLTQKLKIEVSDYILARRLEKEDLIAEITQQKNQEAQIAQSQANSTMFQSYQPSSSEQMISLVSGRPHQQMPQQSQPVILQAIPSPNVMPQYVPMPSPSVSFQNPPPQYQQVNNPPPQYQGQSSGNLPQYQVQQGQQGNPSLYQMNNQYQNPPPQYQGQSSGNPPQYQVQQGQQGQQRNPPSYNASQGSPQFNFQGSLFPSDPYGRNKQNPPY